MKARFFAIALLLPGYLAAETPLSAIDWLDEQRLGLVTEPGQNQIKPSEPPVSSSVNRPDIEVSTLSEIQSDCRAFTALGHRFSAHNVAQQQYQRSRHFVGQCTR